MEKRSYPFFYAGEKQEFGKAVVAGGFVFLSGVSGREVATGKVKSVDIREQTRTAWGKVALALQEVGSTLSKIVKIVIYLKRMEDYEAYREEKNKFLEVHCRELLDTPPAQSLLETRLYKDDMLVEIEITAIL